MLNNRTRDLLGTDCDKVCGGVYVSSPEDSLYGLYQRVRCENCGDVTIRYEQLTKWVDDNSH